MNLLLSIYIVFQNYEIRSECLILLFKKKNNKAKVNQNLFNFKNIIFIKINLVKKIWSLRIKYQVNKYFIIYKFDYYMTN